MAQYGQAYQEMPILLIGEILLTQLEKTDRGQANDYYRKNNKMDTMFP